jgi:hypothetical protein
VTKTPVVHPICTPVLYLICNMYFLDIILMWLRTYIALWKERYISYHVTVIATREKYRSRVIWPLLPGETIGRHVSWTECSCNMNFTEWTLHYVTSHHSVMVLHVNGQTATIGGDLSSCVCPNRHMSYEFVVCHMIFHDLYVLCTESFTRHVIFHDLYVLHT